MSPLVSHQQTLDRIFAAVPNIVWPDSGGHMTLNSRTVKDGDVFVALPGDRQDGRDYMDQALAQGAALVLAEADGFAAQGG